MVDIRFPTLMFLFPLNYIDLSLTLPGCSGVAWFVPLPSVIPSSFQRGFHHPWVHDQLEISPYHISTVRREQKNEGINFKNNLSGTASTLLYT